MNGIFVPNQTHHSLELLEVLRRKMQTMPSQLRQAAAYVLSHPNDIGVHSMRDIAVFADVKPNTLVRMAQFIGLPGYRAFREPFRMRIKQAGHAFPEQAQRLQETSRAGSSNALMAEFADTALNNVARMYTTTSAALLVRAAEKIVRSTSTLVLGVGVNQSLAENFVYLAGMALEHVKSIPLPGRCILDDVASLSKGDVLLAISYRPYRQEIVSAVKLANDLGAHIIAISDSPGAPIMLENASRFTVPTQTPQFFTSTFATLALLETLMAFMIAQSPANAVDKIKQFHALRRRAGLYLSE